jgi:hypothetical protein
MAERDAKEGMGGRFGGGGLASIARVANDARSMIEFCENLVECRRTLMLRLFGEPFHRSRCRKMCDTCLQPHAGVPIDMTYEAALACAAVDALVKQGGGRFPGPTLRTLALAFDNLNVNETFGKKKKGGQSAAANASAQAAVHLRALASCEWSDFGPRSYNSDAEGRPSFSAVLVSGLVESVFARSGCRAACYVQFCSG